MLTHKELFDAIQKIKPVGPYLEIKRNDYATWKHVDDLLAFLDLANTAPNPMTQQLMRQIVAYRLASWGVFDD